MRVLVSHPALCARLQCDNKVVVLLQRFLRKVLGSWRVDVAEVEREVAQIKAPAPPPSTPPGSSPPVGGSGSTPPAPSLKPGVAYVVVVAVRGDALARYGAMRIAIPYPYDAAGLLGGLPSDWQVIGVPATASFDLVAG